MIEDVNFQIYNQGDSPLGLLSDIGVKECVNFWFCNKVKPKAHSLILTKKKKHASFKFQNKIRKNSHRKIQGEINLHKPRKRV
jgi:hypothetical protein